ncbi:ECF-type sigma factor [Paraglaciecola polaris]|uniref:RNA polymerase, sigma-24 subunit, ECF subfamily n=1 Tax=Paraglaciecola polaris LMG 21857 TaxID=1129793 RepID=K6ZUU7_9ALTE|nr:ECF-type sigma factor [Paraglaciecola polaris]GAC32568.1 RNA polymerase, sigma-24 subunit, ECF subfamily [Paraglaciecola polaris LMG 21857]|tara:strand:+ start:1708 stop:2271 length:564 start_codon:yes stop_codon:yes gene_type:complete
MKNDTNITELLHAWQSGSEQAFSDLSEQVYTELHRRAQKHMSQERAGHTLQATALVNEVFVDLLSIQLDFSDRAHFFRLASTMMRRILVDHARAQCAAKRGAGARHVTLLDWKVASGFQSHDVIELDAALSALAKLDKRKAEILELQFFAGSSVQDIAQFYEVSARTIERDGQFGKAWLHRELSMAS